MVKLLVAVLLLVGCKSKEEDQNYRRDPDGPPQPVKVRATKLKADAAELDDKVAKATAAVADAKDDAERAAAQTKLEALQKEQADMKARLEAMDALVKKCAENPVSPGCPH
jgi:hypothetical protein